MKGKKRGVLRVVLILAALTIAVTIWIEVNLAPIVLAMAEARIQAIAADSLNNAVAETAAGIDYANLVSLVIDRSGNITAIQANSARMNELATQTAIHAQVLISRISEQKIDIAIGTALGSQLMSGKGPKVGASIMPVGSVTSEFYSEFSSAGINQTRHRLYIKLTATMRVILPTASSTVEVSTEMPVAETILVGQVPDTYLNSENSTQRLHLIP